jgi:transcription antitermination factor NusG
MYLNLEQQAKLAFNSAKSSELLAIKEEKLAITLKKQGGKAALSGELIQQYSQAAKFHAQAAQFHALAAQKNEPNSLQEYILVGIERQQESKFHLKATKEYIKLIKNLNSLWQEFSEDAFK